LSFGENTETTCRTQCNFTEKYTWSLQRIKKQIGEVAILEEKMEAI
jgi:hypothetical protein